MPEISLWHELRHQSHCVLEQAGSQELNNVAVVQRLQDGHLIQECLSTASVAGLEDFHCHRRRAVQISQVDLHHSFILSYAALQEFLRNKYLTANNMRSIIRALV